ncbi:MAG: phosphopantetheine-binding protein [Prevotella sp.]|nr:phosphopantetheine-binding protein [Prevotella sp.]
MFEKIKELICNYVEVNGEDITEDSRFIEDLGFNSYDFISMLGDLEEEFGVTVDENEIINVHTVGEAVKYLTDLKEN